MKSVDSGQEDDFKQTDPQGSVWTVCREKLLKKTSSGNFAHSGMTEAFKEIYLHAGHNGHKQHNVTSQVSANV